MSARFARSVHSLYAPQSTYSKIARATRFFAISRKSSMQVTTAMAAHFTMWNGRDSPRGSEEPHSGDRAHDEAARRPVAASGAARPEADRAVHRAAPVDRAPHPLVDVGRPHRRSGRAGQLSTGHAPARAGE